MKKVLIIINVALLLFSCGSDQKDEPQGEEQSAGNVVALTAEQIKNSGIETGKLSKRNVSSLLKVNGKIDVPPQSLVSVSVPLGGYLKSTKLLAGMHINKGEVLAAMEDIQYIQLQQDYLTAKAQFALVENEYKRQRDLNESKATSDKVFEQSRANYQTQHVLLKSLEEKLKLIGLNPQKLTADNISHSINIYSPITGFVAAVNVNTGKYVNPSDVLFELVNPLDIHLTLSVFEKDINKLSVGQTLFAYTNTNPGKRYRCEIILISKNLSDQNAAEVHCHFEQYDKNLLPGMFMNAEIELSGHQASTLPDEAIVRFENQNYVFIARGNNQFEMREVETGSTEDNFTEIIGADTLTHTTFVTNGAYNLLMALKNTNDEL